jgi:predicted enzyme related to lactoylglutathione lyase
MITNVKLMGVCVSDQQRALDFYVNKLGFEVLTNEPMGPDMSWIEVAPPGSMTRLALFTPPGLEDRIGSFSQIVFQCDDIQATYEELSQRGVTFTQPPQDQPGGGGVMATFVDPDGNAFVLG